MVWGLELATQLRSLIRDIPDYPVKGVVFRDLTPLFKNREAFRLAVKELARRFSGTNVDSVVGVEARGFIIGAPVALELNAGFIPVRKPGKLPWRKVSVSYQLEYGTESLEMHQDAIKHGDRVLVVDDLLATGGTASATIRLVESLGGRVVGLGFIVELAYLNGREKLRGYRVETLVRIDR